MSWYVARLTELWYELVGIMEDIQLVDDSD